MVDRVSRRGVRPFTLGWVVHRLVATGDSRNRPQIISWRAMPRRVRSSGWLERDVARGSELVVDAPQDATRDRETGSSDAESALGVEVVLVVG